MTQTHFPPSYPISQHWSSPRDPQQVCVQQPLEPGPSKHSHYIPWRQAPPGIASAAVAGGATSCSLQVPRAGSGVSGSFLHLRPWFGSFLLLFQVLGQLLPHVCAAGQVPEEMDPGLFHPASPELALLSKPHLLEGLVPPLAPAGASGVPRAGHFCCYGGLVLFLHWGASLTEFPASHMGFASLPPRG